MIRVDPDKRYYFVVFSLTIALSERAGFDLG